LDISSLVYIFIVMKVYKIKLEDKAALLNRLNKFDVDTNSLKIIDNKIENNFEITFEKPEDLEKMKVILQQSPKINDLKETIRKLVREALKEKFGKAK